MESLFVVIGVIVILCILVVGYFLFLRRVRVRVRKAWLNVYEMFLARADRVPLLVELVRGEVPGHESLLQELIGVRVATAGKALPTQEKRVAEEALGEVLARVVGEIEHHEKLQGSAMFAALLSEFSRWDAEFELAMIGYRRSLAVYQSLAFGSLPDGYEIFS